jgi:hypothetical protein
MKAEIQGQSNLFPLVWKREEGKTIVAIHLWFTKRTPSHRIYLHSIETRSRNQSHDPIYQTPAWSGWLELGLGSIEVGREAVDRKIKVMDDGTNGC